MYNEELGRYEWKEVETDKYVFDETDKIAIAREYHERQCPASEIVSKYHICSAVVLYGWLDKYLNEKVCVSLHSETDNETFLGAYPGVKVKTITRENYMDIL